MGACCLCAWVFKLVLGILNFLLLIIGLLIAGVGGALLGIGQSPAFESIFRFMVVPILDNLLGNGKTLGTSPVGNLNDFYQYLQPAGIALIVGGLVIVAVAILGYCGTSSDISIFLIVYSVILLVILVIEIIVVAMFFSKAFDPYLKKGLLWTLNENYVDLNDPGIFSLLWNFVMLQVKCCGLNNYEDFYKNMQHGNWPKNQTLQNTVANAEPYLEITPVACCNTTGDFPKVTFLNDTCSRYPDDYNSNWNKGCWGAVSGMLSSSRAGALAVLIIAILIQAAILVMAFIIVKEQNSSKG